MVEKKSVTCSACQLSSQPHTTVVKNAPVPPTGSPLGCSLLPFCSSLGTLRFSYREEASWNGPADYIGYECIPQLLRHAPGEEDTAESKGCVSDEYPPSLCAHRLLNPDAFARHQNGRKESEQQFHRVRAVTCTCTHATTSALPSPCALRRLMRAIGYCEGKPAPGNRNSRQAVYAMEHLRGREGSAPSSFFSCPKSILGAFLYSSSPSETSLRITTTPITRRAKGPEAKKRHCRTQLGQVRSESTHPSQSAEHHMSIFTHTHQTDGPASDDPTLAPR